MADAPALRAMRARRHKAGDHAMCRPENCRLAEFPDEQPLPDFTADVGTSGLGDRGLALWRSMNPSSLAPLQREMLLEACRIADRLETLDRQLHGHHWLRFRHHQESDDGGPIEVTVYIDRVLTEAREQQTAFKGLIVELQKAAAAQPKLPTSAGGGGGIADLTARLASRGANAAG